MGNWSVGAIRNPDLDLAVAVAASSAFPPFLSPVILKIEPSQWDALMQPPPVLDSKYRERVVLADGGVADNFGLGPAWNIYDTILLSDASGRSHPVADISTLWFSQSTRVTDLIYGQPEVMRTRQIIGTMLAGRNGTSWRIGRNVADYELPDGGGLLNNNNDLVIPNEKQIQALANIPTRLQSLDPKTQEQLINWGYLIADIALRKHVFPSAARPAQLPYPNAGWPN